MSKRKTAKLRRGGYKESSVSKRILAFFLDNLWCIAVREQIQEAARDPKTGKIPENWHQRLSELRTDQGYTILSWRNRGDLKVMEYVMETTVRRDTAAKRVRPTGSTWGAVLIRSHGKCEWEGCGLSNGDIDPIGGGTVKLTPDHKRPHSANPNTDPADPTQWQALCGRHQVMKKNFWDDSTGKINVVAIVQSASRADKIAVYALLKRFFGDA